MSSLPTDPPVVNPESEPFWEATKRDVLLLPRCDACGVVIWHPRTFCPVCHTRSVSWFEASGRGTIYSYTEHTRGQGPWSDVAPYVVAYVDLDEGPRVLTNIVDCDANKIEIGQTVTVVFDDAGEYKFPRFTPTE
jgi:uncharacterized OB-fold protein